MRARSLVAVLVWLWVSLVPVVGYAQTTGGVQPAYRYRSSLERVIDGDTYVLRVDLGFRVQVMLTFRVRCFNAPEMTGAEKPLGERAKQAAQVLLARGPIVVESYKDDQSFARWVADVYVDGVSIVEPMVAAGHGRATCQAARAAVH